MYAHWRLKSPCGDAREPAGYPLGAGFVSVARAFRHQAVAVGLMPAAVSPLGVGLRVASPRVDAPGACVNPILHTHAAHPTLSHPWQTAG
jgi:hypothetical protein